MGCGTEAVVFDLICKKPLCWLHMCFEHPRFDWPKEPSAPALYYLL
jgi:hypothetical protein